MFERGTDALIVLDGHWKEPQGINPPLRITLLRRKLLKGERGRRKHGRKSTHHGTDSCWNEYECYSLGCHYLYTYAANYARTQTRAPALHPPSLPSPPPKKGAMCVELLEKVICTEKNKIKFPRINCSHFKLKLICPSCINDSFFPGSRSKKWISLTVGGYS